MPCATGRHVSGDVHSAESLQSWNCWPPPPHLVVHFVTRLIPWAVAQQTSPLGQLMALVHVSGAPWHCPLPVQESPCCVAQHTCVDGSHDC